MDLMLRPSCDPRLSFTPHPGIFTYLYDLSFASGSFSLAHFAPLSDHQRRTWNDEATVNPCNYSASVTPPRAQKLRPAQDILDALDTLDAFFHPTAYGSVCASQFFSSAKRFCLALHRRFAIQPASVPVVVAWLDDKFKKFGSTISTDYTLRRIPPLHLNAHLDFDNDGTAAYELLLSITHVHIGLTTPTPSMSRHPHFSTTAVTTSPKPNTSHDRVGITPAIRMAIPLVDGKPI
ncbi:hypothetical protein DYB25_007799 [Aphanomyces astaci]|uniref:Uncharacterized protein n=1 Tax=Aphanomyces astaci TaxID=112090 RepID=A0A397DJ55_APHAT|nr:hypothetical protein DYB36_003356 [Aphanomyces astaci]RHY24323.1 hypothetical protein DYB25_007799 [Aphanomyces astaci]RHY49201.1 hypothetical protein DYB34_008325 [Aphanomyces astaci]RHY66176.1 hypothetical protein DYB30_011489 [Aphanomyces astaci]RHY77451.1 hypothetical protein DYB38_007483 [Aphanomyces astaci]